MIPMKRVAIWHRALAIRTPTLWSRIVCKARGSVVDKIDIEGAADGTVDEAGVARIVATTPRRAFDALIFDVNCRL